MTTDPLVEEIRQLAETKLPICLEARTLLRMAVTAQELEAPQLLVSNGALFRSRSRDIEAQTWWSAQQRNTYAGLRLAAHRHGRLAAKQFGAGRAG